MTSFSRRVLPTLCGSFASHLIPRSQGRRDAVMKVAAMVLVAVMAAVPGNAQTGTSLDCAKASNKVERTICGDVDLRDAERTVNAEFAALTGRLSGPAKEHLLANQLQWVVDSRNYCGDEELYANVRCLRRSYLARIETLKALAEGPYPFVSEQSLFRRGTVGNFTHSVNAIFPQFDGKTADFSGLNRSYSEWARMCAEQFADDISYNDQPAPQTPRTQVPEQYYRCMSDFAVQRPAADAIALELTYGQFRGQAHPWGVTPCHLVNLRTGRRASPGDVFVKGDGRLDVLVPLVRAELEKQFIKKGRTDFDREIEPDKIAAKLHEDFFCYRRDGLKLAFGPYVFGTYADGSYAVDVPYSVLKPILAADGPLGSLR
jgi:uncharacterized protein